MIDRILAPMDAFAEAMRDAGKARWWVWPSFLVAVMLATWASSLLVEPRPDEWTYLFGTKIGDTCAMIQMTGEPCPSCGMTRSFAHAARLHLLRSWTYNPAGLGLFLWITASGIVGLIRLVTRDPKKLSPPNNLLLGWVLLWAFGLYTAGWVLRLWGVNPLP